MYQIVFVSGENQIKYRLLNVINLMSQVGNSLLGVGQIGHQSWHAPSCVRRAGGKSKPLFALLSAKIKHNQPPRRISYARPQISLRFLSLSLSLSNFSSDIFPYHWLSSLLFVCIIYCSYTARMFDDDEGAPLSVSPPPPTLCNSDSP